MKAFLIGIVSAAILMVVAAVGFGIAQAGESDTLSGGVHGTIGEFREGQTLDQDSSSSSDAENRPVLSFEDQENTRVAKSPQDFVPEGNWSGTDWQAGGPIETGVVPETVFEESWMNVYGDD